MLPGSTVAHVCCNQEAEAGESAEAWGGGGGSRSRSSGGSQSVSQGCSAIMVSVTPSPAQIIRLLSSLRPAWAVRPSLSIYPTQQSGMNLNLKMRLCLWMC